MALKDFSLEKFDIIIQAGQSNSEGYGFGNVPDPYQPSDRVWYLNGDFTFQIAQEATANNAIQSNFSLSFAREYMNAGRLAEDRKLLILRTAVGGTGFSVDDWKAEDPLYLRMMEMIRTALSLNPENRLIALLWHQGETDADHHVTYDYYRGHLSYLLGSVREEFGVPDLPFVAGDLSQDWKSTRQEQAAPVVAALRDICASQNASFVESDGLDSNRQDGFPHPFGWVDEAHFCRRAVYELGRRYYAAYVSIVDAK